MNQQIRKSVFETNSSSSHSLTLSTSELVAQPFGQDVLREGVLRLTVGEYGWEYYRYFTPAEKLRYLLTQQTGGKVEGTSERAAAETTAMCEENHRLAMMARVVAEHTGVRLEFQPSEGYVDHDSVGVGSDLFADDETLKRFLFTFDSYIQTGNDNSPAPWRIDTDLGEQLAYEQFVKPVPAEYVAVKLHAKERYRFNGFTTPKGAVLSDAFNAKLLKKVLKAGIVEFVHWKCKGNYDRFEHREVVPQSAEYVLREPQRMTLAPNFGATYEHEATSRGEFRMEEDTVLTVRLPAALAKEIRALSRTPRLLVQLQDAREELTTSKRFSVARKAHGESGDDERLTKAQAEVDKLTAQAKKKGLV